MTYTEEEYNDLIRAKAAEMQTLRIELANEMAAAEESHVAELEALKVAHKAELDKILNIPSPATVAFRSLPVEIQEQFEKSFEIASLLVEAGRTDIAIAHIECLTVPAKLVPVKNEILRLLANA